MVVTEDFTVVTAKTFMTFKLAETKNKQISVKLLILKRMTFISISVEMSYVHCLDVQGMRLILNKMSNSLPYEVNCDSKKLNVYKVIS